MENASLRIAAIFLTLANSYSAFGAEDFDCYSEDSEVIFAGKTMERDGSERFISGLNVWVRGNKVAKVLNEDLRPEDNPYHFEYQKQGLSIKFDWEGTRSLTLDYEGEEDGVGAYSFSGKLICY